MVRVVPLGSGSSGNALLVEFGAKRLLIDAGLSAKDLTARLGETGLSGSDISAILLSHEHHDHARGLERFAQKARVPVFTTPEALAALNLAPRHLHAWQPFEPGVRFEAGGVSVDPFPILHDAANPVGFILESEGVRVGIAVDLGHVTPPVVARLRGCHVLIVEANHDDAMLARGPYPWALKQRIGGRLGHLSNEDAAALVAASADGDCQAVILAHLSESNNTEALARQAVADAMDAAGRSRYAMRVARRHAPTLAVEI